MQDSVSAESCLSPFSGQWAVAMGLNAIESRPVGGSAEVLEDLAHASRSLEALEPLQIIAWAVERYGQRLTMATAFGPEGCLIIHWLATIAPKTFVFNLDTGYQFNETLELRDRIARRYGVRTVRPPRSLAGITSSTS